MLLVADDPWTDWFHGLQRSAFHLEVRDSYVEPSEDNRFRAFLAGEAVPDEPPVPWHALMHRVTGRGVSVTRVRVVTVPHSDYHRWLLSITGRNIRSGEDIRYLPRHDAGEVPPDDFWLFDDERVVYNLADDGGRPAGAALTTDPRIVDYCRSVRDRFWKLATPYMEYVTS
ncbi:DUF6879 family protein [Nocardia jinanensis]|uniref:DUF6879 domain-containing protein n=1 Tax=Nocardia jinanensis TaxID=382504 RepID=A0A917RW51_9NOCA|nr:DUF6879 family protein [Nocardia jinanensis]GGL38740.1 hypothetical protein GCM10011588_61690 [Nocardia jinanensis]